MNSYIPEEHDLAAEQRKAQNWQNAANWTLQAAQLGLDAAKTVQSIKTQDMILRQDNFNNRYKEIWAEKIDAGIQPFEEADGEMKFTQYQELQDLGKEYVEEVLQKYGAEAAERAQAHVDGKKIDDFFNAAQMLNKLDIDTIHGNSDTAINRAVEAGSFGVYEQWAATVEDPLLRSQLLEAGKKKFEYDSTLKSAQRTFDTQGLSAAQQLIDGTGYTDRQKEDLKASVAGYARQQTGIAENDAVNTFTKAMEATGGDITASVAAARAAATSVSGSLETKLATEDDISNLRARALSDRFNGDYIAHTDNPAWMRQEADRLRSAGSKSGDYEGQSGLLNAHIMAYERVADAADAEKAARESAAAKAAEKARIEAQESVSVLSADVFSAWSRGQFPGYSLNTLAKSVLTDENIRDNVRLEDIHKNAKKALEQNAPWIAAVFGASDRWMSAKFPNFSKKDYNPTPKEIEEYADASRWAFATEMEIIGNAPYSVLNADAGKMINRLNAALSAKDLGKIDPGNTLKTIQALESGALDNAVALDPNADPYIDPRDSDYVYPNAETKEKYTRFGQQVANLLQSEGVIEKADDVEMRHFPEQGADGRVFGAAGNVYFVDGEGTKYRATAKGKEIVFQRQEEEQDVLTGDWTDIPIREQPKKTGFWEGVKEFFSLPAEPRR